MRNPLRARPTQVFPPACSGRGPDRRTSSHSHRNSPPPFRNPPTRLVAFRLRLPSTLPGFRRARPRRHKRCALAKTESSEATATPQHTRRPDRSQHGSTDKYRSAPSAPWRPRNPSGRSRSIPHRLENRFPDRKRSRLPRVRHSAERAEVCLRVHAVTVTPRRPSATRRLRRAGPSASASRFTALASDRAARTAFTRPRPFPHAAVARGERRGSLGSVSPEGRISRAALLCVVLADELR